MELFDSRRLTGPNLLSRRPGAVCDVRLSATRQGAFVAGWGSHARAMLDALGWGGEETFARTFRGGANLAISAPIDALYAATEVNEWAVAATAAALEGTSGEAMEAARDRLAAVIARERNPALVRLEAAASERGVRFLSDDDDASVGTGRGALTWPVDALPAPEEVEWAEVSDVPVALVTGTNGKTTTVRLLGAIARAAGCVPGWSSTDGIVIGGATTDRGDWSGPGGARAVLRDRRVEVALLETARGGLLRRGLGVRRAEAALVTNIGEDHLGEFGVEDLGGLAETKLVVARAIEAGGRLVLGGDDDELVRRGPACGVPLAWFALERALARPGEGDAPATFVEAGRLVLEQSGERLLETPLTDVPITLAGAAVHNILNALAAALVARTLGFDAAAITAGLSGFRPTPEENPGRMNLFELGGATAVVDFAHNPHGFAALLDVARALPARRRLVVLGQAGDRDDDAIRALAGLAGRLRPARLVVKEMEPYLRGRPVGEIPRILVEGFVAGGGDPGVVVHADDELGAVGEALRWAADGDLLVLTVHAARDAVIGWLEALRSAGWRPGDVVPPPPAPA